MENSTLAPWQEISETGIVFSLGVVCMIGFGK